MTPGDTPSKLPPDQAPDDDDDILDLEIEDVLDLAPSAELSSSSAIDGVEMLDFLDDDDSPPDHSDENTAGSAPLDMTIDMASPRAADAEVVDAEIENIGELEEVDVADLGEEQIDVIETAADEELSPVSEEIVEVDSLEELDATDVEEMAAEEVVESAADEIGPKVVETTVDSETDDFLGEPSEAEDIDEDMFAGLETGDATVNHKREPTTVSDAGAVAGDVETTEPNLISSPDSIDEIEEEFALRGDAAEEVVTNEGSADVSFAAAVSPTATVARPKKKSSLPLVLIVLFVFLLLGGVGGLYFAGMLPGMGDGPIAGIPPGADSDGSPTDGTAVDTSNDLAERTNDAQEKLLDLFRASRTGEQIDGEKLAAAQQILADLAANDEQVLAQEPIEQLKTRFDELAKDFAKQERNNAEAERARKFRDALAFAGANAPKSLDAGALEEARTLANEEELKQIAALEQEVADYQVEQARLAAAELKAKQQTAFDAIVAAAAGGNSVEYGEMLAAYATDYPKAPVTVDLQEVAKSDPAALDVVVNWNALLDKWSLAKLSDVTSEAAAAMVEAAEGQLDAGTAELPGAAEVTARLTLLRTVANRETAMKEAFIRLAGVLASPPTKSSYVFAMQDGHRYYSIEKPAKSGDNYAVNRFVDLEGKTESIELAPADADRTATGAATVAATAQAVDEALDKIEPTNIDAPLWEAMATVLADEKLDPVIKVQWLVALAEAEGKVLPHLANATAPYNNLRKTGVDGTFNWTDAAAAAKVRAACQEALAALPKLDESKKQAESERASMDRFAVSSRLSPIAVLAKGAEDAWKPVAIDGAPASGEVFVLVKGDEGLASLSVGEFKDGEFAAADDADATLLRQGRILYAKVTVPATTPTSE